MEFGTWDQQTFYELQTSIWYVFNSWVDACVWGMLACVEDKDGSRIVLVMVETENYGNKVISLGQKVDQ